MPVCYTNGLPSLALLGRVLLWVILQPVRIWDAYLDKLADVGLVPTHISLMWLSHYNLRPVSVVREKSKTA